MSDMHLPDVVDVAVVGGGVIGLSVAWALSKLSPELKGAVLEASILGNQHGGSFGQSRMYRQMYSDPYFSTMQAAALALWRQLEAESGQSLLRPHGLLFYGEADTGATVEGSIPGAVRVMQQLGVPYQYLPSAAELNQRWPMQAPSGFQGVFEPGAGAIQADQACQVLLQEAQRTSWTVHEKQRVVGISASSDAAAPVVLTTSSGARIQAGRVVLAAGSWTNDLLALLGRQLDLELWRVHWGHCFVDPQLQESYPQWYCFQKEKEGQVGTCQAPPCQQQATEQSASHSSRLPRPAGEGDSGQEGIGASSTAAAAQAAAATGAAGGEAEAAAAAEVLTETAADSADVRHEARWDARLTASTACSSHEGAMDGAACGDGTSYDGGLYYGFPPEDHDDQPVVKVGVDFAAPTPLFRLRSMKGFSYQPDPGVVALLERFLHTQWRGFGRLKDVQCSPYDMTCDQCFVLGALRDFPAVSLFAGGCGRAFKFAPLLGKCLAEVALGRLPSYDVAPLSVTRPAAGYCSCHSGVTGLTAGHAWQ